MMVLGWLSAIGTEKYQKYELSSQVLHMAPHFLLLPVYAYFSGCPQRTALQARLLSQSAAFQRPFFLFYNERPNVTSPRNDVMRIHILRYSSNGGSQACKSDRQSSNNRFFSEPLSSSHFRSGYENKIPWTKGLCFVWDYPCPLTCDFYII